jgi:hypothetical protein
MDSLHSLSLTDLPDDILLEIAKQLDFSSLVQLCAVNRHCHGLFSVDNFGQIWKHLYQRDLSTRRLPEANKYRRVYDKMIRETHAMDLNQQLVYAATHGYEQLVKSLVQRGANQYNEAIIEAKDHNHQDIFDYLLPLNGGTYQPRFQPPFGYLGPVGPLGIQGPVGPFGIQGPVGPFGIQGPVGPLGIQGPVGPFGIQV